MIYTIFRRLIVSGCYELYSLLDQMLNDLELGLITKEQYTYLVSLTNVFPSQYGNNRLTDVYCGNDVLVTEEAYNNSRSILGL